MNTAYGPCYNEMLDGVRIRGQLIRLLDYMNDGYWHTLPEIAVATDIPESSASADLRHLRKPEHGGWIIEKRRLNQDGALWEYKLSLPIPNGQLGLL